MIVRCEKGHTWELQNLNWAEVDKGESNKVSDVSCPKCGGVPIEEVKIKEAEKMGNKEEGRKLTKIE